MKKITSYVALIILITFCVISCKKKDTKATTAEKVQGTWQLHSDISNEHVNGIDNFDTTLALPGSTIEFRNDGKVYTTTPDEKDTATYSLSGDTKLIIDNIAYDIKTLTSNTFQLYIKESQGADYYEETVNLTR
jgi:hypothetical protein